MWTFWIKGGYFVILYFPNKSALTFSIATLLDAIEEEKQAVGHQQSAKQIEARESEAEMAKTIIR
jgi:hypothetical protein